MRPEFPHSIKDCVFLGTFRCGRMYDLYVRHNGEEKNLIARFGTRPFEYQSTKPFTKNKPPQLQEAEERAIARGLLARPEDQNQLSV